MRPHSLDSASDSGTLVATSRLPAPPLLLFRHHVRFHAAERTAASREYRWWCDDDETTRKAGDSVSGDKYHEQREAVRIRDGGAPWPSDTASREHN